MWDIIHPDSQMTIHSNLHVPLTCKVCVFSTQACLVGSPLFSSRPIPRRILDVVTSTMQPKSTVCIMRPFLLNSYYKLSKMITFLRLKKSCLYIIHCLRRNGVSCRTLDAVSNAFSKLVGCGLLCVGNC